MKIEEGQWEPFADFTWNDPAAMDYCKILNYMASPLPTSSYFY